MKCAIQQGERGSCIKIINKLEAKCRNCLIWILYYRTFTSMSNCINWQWQVSNWFRLVFIKRIEEKFGTRRIVKSQVVLSFICMVLLWRICHRCRTYLMIKMLLYWLVDGSHFRVRQVVICPIWLMEVAVRGVPPMATIINMLSNAYIWRTHVRSSYLSC